MTADQGCKMGSSAYFVAKVLPNEREGWLFPFAGSYGTSHVLVGGLLLVGGSSALVGDGRIQVWA